MASETARAPCPLGQTYSVTGGSIKRLLQVPIATGIWSRARHCGQRLRWSPRIRYTAAAQRPRNTHSWTTESGTNRRFTARAVAALSSVTATRVKTILALRYAFIQRRRIEKYASG